MITRTEDMARFLPEVVRVAKTPDVMNAPCNGSRAIDVSMDIVELKTVDIINAFMSLKGQAIAEANRIKSERHRAMAISKIKSMAHFAP